MSWAHIFTTHEFWLGVPSGAVVAAIPALIGARSLRHSDTRKAAQEDKVQTRKEEREDKLRDEESLYNVAMDYIEVCTEILENTVDIKGAFNVIRDMFYNLAGADDPKADDKFDHATNASEEMKRIMKPFNKLRLIAPTDVIDAATDVNMALLATLRATTEPFAQPVTRKAAADAIEKFANVFRAEIGKDMYTASQAQERAMSFFANLQKQVDDYVEESKAEMRTAGFKTTPWDMPSTKPSEPGATAEEPTTRTSFLGRIQSVPVRSLNIGENISLPIAQRGTGSIGLRSTIRSFNDDRTRMTVFVQKSGKTVTLNVGPDQQFDRVAAAP